MNTLLTLGIALITSAVSVFGIYNWIPLDILQPAPETNFGSTITTIAGSDTLSSSRAVINTNFSNLNTDKIQSGDTVASLTITSGTIGTLTLTNPLTIANGGTGSTTLSSNQILLGNGTSLIKTVTGMGTSGDILTSTGSGSAPTWQSGVSLSANNTWSGTNLFTASTTQVATTSISASSVTNNALILNGVAYAFPSSRAASSTALMEDGSGNLRFLPNFNQKTYLRATSVTLTQGASTTVISVNIPANTLGANNAIVCTVPISITVSADAGARINFGLSYGGVSTTTAAILGDGANVLTGAKGVVTVILAASGATNTQRLTQSSSFSTNTVSQGQQSVGMQSAGTAAVDSTVANVLEFIVNPQVGATSGTADTAICELIR